jgi:glycosyltransferase involved in cell wall biosynthesis
LNVVFFTYRYWPAIGGVEKYVHELGKSLVGMGHRVAVVTGAHEPGLPRRETKDGLDIHRYPAYRSRVRCWLALQRLRPVFEAADVVHISDVLMVEYYHAMVAWTVRRRPIFLTRHGMSCRCPVPVEEKQRALRASRLVDGTIDDGNFIARWLGVPGDTVLDQGLRPSAADIEQTPEPAVDAAVFVGRLEWDSAVTKFIEAVAVLRRDYGIELPLEVYGDGSLRAELDQRVRRDNLPVRLHGFVEGAQDRYADAKFAFASGRLAIQEAMVRRRLVITTYVNDLRRDYVSGEPFSPYLEVGATPEAIADRVAHFIANPADRARRVQEAYDHVCTLSWDRTARGYLDLWGRSSKPIEHAPNWFERASLALRLASEWR